MANNLHISYDLYEEGQNYAKVIEAIKSLGSWAKIHKSYWYVKSNHSAKQAAEIVWNAMDSNDTVYVVDATNNVASWHNLKDEVSDFIVSQWNVRKAA